MNEFDDDKYFEPQNEQIDMEALKRAAELLDAILDEQIPARLKEVLQGWFKSSVSKAEKYEALRKIFAEIRPNLHPDKYEYEQYAKICELLGFEPEAPKAKLQKRRSMTLGRVSMRVAAVLIPVMAIAGAAYLWMQRDVRHDPAVNVTVAVAADAQKRIVLPDGTQVWVNHDSELGYNDDFSQERFVTLTGEAYFKVTKDTSRPFRVKAGDLTVEVLGTEFEVTARKGISTAEVALVSGSVRTEAFSRKVDLMPGNKAVLDFATRKTTIEKLPDSNFSKWRVSDLVMDNIPLDAALHRVAAYYGKDIIIDEQIPLFALINLSTKEELTLDSALDLISDISGGFEYRIEGDKIIISPKI